jgi:hypothetical protein
LRSPRLKREKQEFMLPALRFVSIGNLFKMKDWDCGFTVIWMGSAFDEDVTNQ